VARRLVQPRPAFTSRWAISRAPSTISPRPSTSIRATATRTRIRGIAYASVDNFPAALKDLDQAIRLEPDRAGFYSNRAEVKRARGDNAGATADEKKARDLKLEHNYDY